MKDKEQFKDETIKYILISAGVLILLIATILIILKVAGNRAKDIGCVWPASEDAYTEEVFSEYEDTYVSGSEVLTALDRFKEDDIYIAVENGSGTTTYYFKDEDGTENKNTIALAKSKKDLNHYISTSSKYSSEVIRSDSGIIQGIVFIHE